MDGVKISEDRADAQWSSQWKKKEGEAWKKVKDQRSGRGPCNSRGRPSCQIVVDLFLFNLLTPRVTLYPSLSLSLLSLHFSFSRREPLGSRVSREKSMPEGPGRRISRGGEGPARQGQRLTENDEGPRRQIAVREESGLYVPAICIRPLFPIDLRRTGYRQDSLSLSLSLAGATPLSNRSRDRLLHHKYS